jgi:tetratricopeptide (TPR) repeat protein
MFALRGQARAEVVYEPPIVIDPERGVFWRDIVEPHKDEIQTILRKARQALQQADAWLAYDYEHIVESHDRIYRDVYGMLRFARKLAPDNIEVLTLLGQAADGIGKTREAIEALHMAVQLVGPEKAGSDVTGRLGAIYLRLGELDDALRYLRLAQGPVLPSVPASARVLVDLSTALALHGEMSEAIDVLLSSLPTTNPGYYPNEVLLVSFALAVQYDRDEQRGAAFEVIDRLETVLQGQLAAQLQASLIGFRFAPAEDQHYYLGLFYEIGGYYSEARTEWALYAAAGNSPWRARALDHIIAIDAERRKGPPKPATPPKVIFKPIHHP